MLTVKRINTRSGMTFVEIMVSLGLFILLLGVSLSIWSFVYKTWAVENIRTKLRVNLEMAVENIKSELRLSSAEFISLYKPPSESDYKAISFSLPTIGNDGFAVLQADGTIFWDRSVIYHVYENPPGSGTLELRRTEFTDNHDILINTSQREAQLSSVYTNGSGTGALNGLHFRDKDLNSAIWWTLL
jgi:type II secretory pathway pseudopilin PulG